uniref:Arginyl-tRNA--protein transferase 1 n=1 Tax=Esox lucius TaxID=8010 RepID=A0A6Q2XDF8_ESOLU
MASYTIVEYFGGDDGYRCGYCKNEKGNFSHGMWSHAMTVQDYQDLIDRGWRRSGKYVYKPIMNKTCCPQYTIRYFIIKETDKINLDKTRGILIVLSHWQWKMKSPELLTPLIHSDFEQYIFSFYVLSSPFHPPPPPPLPGVGPDPGRPVCRKAKDLRRERRLQKDQKRQQESGSVPTCNPAATPVPPSQPKALEEFIDESLPGSPLHRLEVRLVPVNDDDPQFAATYEQSAALYACYQMAIHGDAPSECNESEFRRFLCDSPLEAETSPDGPETGYGSFHQQYWLDGHIVAVGVVDILPTCVSSVYLYYHPDFASLSLGSYSALREIAFTRQLQKQSPKLCYYYLGFYIHSCPKMRYKGQYQPCDLLCPETYVFVPIEHCIPSLEQSRYARFNPDPDAGDKKVLKDLGRLLVLYRRAVMPYAAFARKRKGSNDEAEVEQYARLVGQVCAERILLYRA